MKTAAICTLGCKVNQYESEAMGELLTKNGFTLVDFHEKADYYIINTCTVTNMSDRKSRQMIRRARHKNPDAVIAVSGCYAQTAPEEVAKIEGVNLIIGTKGRRRIAELLKNASGGQMNLVSPTEKEFEKLEIEGFQEHSRAFLKIQDGCEQYCSYCIIPYARGRVRSRPMEDIVSEIARLCANGFAEIVLTGIHVASYGKDLDNVTLLDVIKRAAEFDDLKRIRISSIEPNIITDSFCKELSRIEKFCPHFHISLQSGCDGTLKRMNRKYDTAKYAECLQNVRKHFDNPAISTDVMVGFAGETEQEFAESLAFVEQCAFSKVHVFPYSIRTGTQAEHFPHQVDGAIKEKRTQKMLALAEKLEKNFLNSQVGKTGEVLVEQEQDGLFEGFTKNYAKVKFSSCKELKGRIVKVTLRESHDGFLLGELEQ